MLKMVPLTSRDAVAVNGWIKYIIRMNLSIQIARRLGCTHLGHFSWIAVVENSLGSAGNIRS